MAFKMKNPSLAKAMKEGTPLMKLNYDEDNVTKVGPKNSGIKTSINLKKAQRGNISRGMMNAVINATKSKKK